MKYKFHLGVFLSCMFTVYMFSCESPVDALRKIEIVISDRIKDTLHESRYALDSIQILSIDTVREWELIKRQNRYHDAKMQRMEELANYYLSNQFLLYSKYKFFIQTGDSSGASGIQKEMDRATLSASRFSDSAQLYKHILDSLNAVVLPDSSKLVYYRVYYKAFFNNSNKSPKFENSSVVLTPDYKIRNPEPIKDLVINIPR